MYPAFTQVYSRMYNDALQLSSLGIAGGFLRGYVKFDDGEWGATVYSAYVGLFDPLIYSAVTPALS